MPRNKGLSENWKYRFIRRELIRLYGNDTAESILSLAKVRYAECEQLCQSASEGEWSHLHGTILPTVSFYKALRQIDPDHAFDAVHAVTMRLCQTGGAAINMLLVFPGMRTLFMHLLPIMAKNMFGERCGFHYENYKANSRMLSMDMTACPYCRYAVLLGCPELMSVFCDSDFATYGHLRSIRFERTMTLGSGADRCDFRFTRD